MRDRFYSEMKMQYALHMKSDFHLNKYNRFSLYAVYVGITRQMYAIARLPTFR